MTPEEYYQRGKKLLADAEGRYRSGSWDLAKVEAALAQANLDAVPLQRFLEGGGFQRQPFDDPRELRAWCLDRAVALRGWMLEGKEAEGLIAVAEKFRAYVASGAADEPEPEATDV